VAALDFHRSSSARDRIADATRSSFVRIWRAYEALQLEIRLALIQLKRAYSAVAPLAAEHRVLLEAVRSGPVSNAVGLMRDHLEQAVADLTRNS
jgi:DNA-binding GntR family transcriptional regulator